MASIRDAIQKNQQRIAAGGETGTGLGPQPPQNPLVVAPSPQLDLPISNSPQRGTYPASLILGGDINDSNRMFRGAGMRSTTFPNPNTTNVTKSTTIVQAAAASAATASALLIEVDGAPTPVQNVLNLIEGGGITLVPDASGGVTITGTSTGDGLIHGDAIWEIDPAYLYIRDDFQSLNLAGITSNFSSEYAWDVTSAVTPKYVPGPFPHTGNIAFSNNNSANASSVLVPGIVGADVNFHTNSWPLFDYPSWKLIWIFSIARVAQSSVPSVPFNFSNTSFYIGLAQHYQFADTQTRPSYFFGLRFDTDTTAPSIGDTTFHFETVSNNNGSTRDNAQGATFDTGVVPTEFVQYRLELLYTANGTLQFTLVSSAGDNVVHSLAVPQYTTPNGVEIKSANGLADFFLRSLNGGPAAGSIVTFNGLNAPTNVFDGAQTITDQITGAAHYVFPFAATVADTITTAATAVGFPAVLPYVGFGNDSNVSPTANSKGLLVDFFSFAWNPGVGGGTGTPNSSLTRYF